MHPSRVLISVPLAVGFCVVLVLPARALSPGPLEDCYWRYEDGPLGDPVPVVADYLWDDSGNGNHQQTQSTNTAPIFVADVPAPTVPATGQANTMALWFDGVQEEGPGDEIFVTGKTVCNPTNVVGFTIEASFKADEVMPGTDYNQTVFGKDSNTFTNDVPAEILDKPTAALRVRGDNNKLEWEQVDKATNLVSVVSAVTIEADRWYHAAVVNDGTNVTLYVDANDGMGFVLQGSAPVDGALYECGASGFKMDPPYVWCVGRSMFGVAKVDYFGGVVDEVRLTAHALEPTEFLFYTTPPDLAANSIEKLPDDKVRVIFTDSNPEGETYGLARASDPAGPFTDDPGAVVSDLGGGVIQADVPVGAEASGYFKGTSAP